jgi:predicted dinucleotide-binding enzyme
VVKAFNTTLAADTVGQVPITVLIVDDDGQAKSLLAEVVTLSDLRAIDAGSLRRARELEALAFLQVTLAAQGKVPWTGGFAVIS